MALAATTSILLMAACGSGGNPVVPPLPGGFSDASLSGTYVMRQTGFGGTGAFSETSVFTADGKGKLTITVDDIQNPTPVGPGEETLTGTYNINSDGTGLLTFDYTPTSSNYQITMIDDNHFYAMEGDTYATSSGYGVLQTSIAAPSGTFVFKAHNTGFSSRVGAVTLAGANITGNEDLIVLESAPTSSVINGGSSAPDSNGRGTFTLTDGSSFNYYVVSPSEFYFMSNSSAGSLEIGQANVQTATTLAAGSYVFGSRGDTVLTNPLGIHSAGVFTTDGVSTISGGTVDYVQDTNVYAGATVSDPSGFTLAASGRGTTNLLLSGAPAVSQIFWVVNGTSAYYITDNTAAAEDGSFSLQSGAPFSALTSQAAFVIDGFPSVPPGQADQVGAFEPTSSTAFNWKEQANQAGGLTAIGTNGTYTVSANGRVAVTVNGITPSLIFYLSSANTGFMVEEDWNDGGVFALQASQ